MSECLKCYKAIQGSSLYGLHTQCFLSWFGLTGENLEFTDLDPKKSGSGSSGSPKIKKKKDTFFHGRYLKFSARLEGVEYILKIQEENFPELPAMEFVCNRVAEVLSLEVPHYFFIDFKGRKTFVTRNFMQDHIGTLNHIYKYLPEGAENHNCEKIIEILLEQTGRMSEVAKFVEICLFDGLIGNNDRHGRNLGLIVTGKGQHLAPIYDNPSYFGVVDEFLLGAQLNPSGSIWTQASQEPKVGDYLEEFKRLGYSRVVKIFARRVLSRIGVIADEVSNSHLSLKRKQAFLGFIENQIEAFENV